MTLLSLEDVLSYNVIRMDIEMLTSMMLSSLNRYSMPVTKSRIPFYDLASLDQANTARFLFGDDEASSSVQFSHQDSNNSYNSSNRHEMVSCDLFFVC